MKGGREAALLAAASVAFCAVLLTPAIAVAAAGEPATPSVDLAAPVKAGSQCVPCHARIAEARKPGIIFAHAAHLLISCDACHWVPAHQGGTTVGPPMESCFNCHGIRHAGKTLARADCPACHTKNFKLRPGTHGKDWAQAPHAKRAAAGANSCLMCHDAKACDDCHIRGGIKAAPTQPYFQPLLPSKPRRPPIKVYPTGRVTMGQCVNCHPDVDAFMPGRVIFAHATHLRNAFRCTDCHETFAHGPDTTYRPDMPTCYACHGLVHAAAGTVATGKCAACHPKGFALKPPDHTPAFEKKTHKNVSNRDPSYCAMCHEPAFCTGCHQGRPARPGGPRRRKVVPTDHRKAAFRTSHGKLFLAQRGACGSCHDSASCEKCHRTPMPHPADWTAQHALAKGLDTRDCNVCHTDRERCQQCHHTGLRGAELIAANCVRCHPIMNTKPATRIKNKGFAEHAVHFDVAKRRGKPYKCEDCHIGFDTSRHIRTAQSGKLKLSHDLRLCYDCHGALDARNRLIAPYPGNQLCIRCHTDLRI